MSGALLSVRALSLSYHTPDGMVPALRDVSLDVVPGRVSGLVGESGSGKSTLAAAILRLIPPNASIDRGEILFEGRDLARLPAAGIRAVRGAGIAMIFQDPMTALNPVRSIEAQMTDVLHRERLSRRAKRARAVEMLERVGIPDAAARIGDHAHRFSGGMRQRICIAMALMVHPSLLIADEPTTALDVTTEAQIVALLKELQAETGCAMLFVSHDLGLIAELCDETTVMYAGEMVESGPTAEVFGDPRHPYTRRLLDCDPARIAGLTRRLPTIPGQVPDPRALPPGCVFAPRCDRRFAPCDSVTPAVTAPVPGRMLRCHLEGRR